MSFTYVPAPVFEPYRPETYQTIRDNMILMLEAVRDGLIALVKLSKAQNLFDKSSSINGGPKIRAGLPFRWTNNDSLTVESNAVNFFSYLENYGGYAERIGYIIDELKRTSINSPRLCGVSTYVIHSLTMISVSDLNVTNSYRTSQWNESVIEFSDSPDHWMEAVLKYSAEDMFLMVVSDIVSKMDLSKVDLMSIRLHYQALQNREYMLGHVSNIRKITEDIKDATDKLTVLEDAITTNSWDLMSDMETLCKFLGPESSITYITTWVAWAS